MQNRIYQKLSYKIGYVSIYVGNLRDKISHQNAKTLLYSFRLLKFFVSDKLTLITQRLTMHKYLHYTPFYTIVQIAKRIEDASANKYLFITSS